MFGVESDVANCKPHYVIYYNIIYLGTTTIVAGITYLLNVYKKDLCCSNDFG